MSLFLLKELPTESVLLEYQKKFPRMNPKDIKKALVMLQRASSLMRKIDAYFFSHDFSQLKYLILIVLDRELEGNGLFVSEIAERLDVSRPVMTRTVQGLLDCSMLKMKDDPSDGRSKIVTLTKKGKAKLDDILPGYYEVIQKFMAEEK